MAEKPRNPRPPSTPEKSVEQRTIRELMRDPSYGMPMSAEGQVADALCWASCPVALTGHAGQGRETEETNRRTQPADEPCT